MLKVNGKEFKSFNAACLYYEIAPSYLYKRSKALGIPKEELLQKRLDRGVRKHPIHFKGVTYRNLSDVCKAYNLNPVKVQSLVSNRGISRNQALELSVKHQGAVPRERKGIEVIIKGESFPSIAAACRYYNVSPSGVRNLTRKGYTYEQAIKMKRSEG